MRRKFVEYLGTDCFNFCRVICCQHVEYKMYEVLLKMHGQLHVEYIVHDERGGRGSIFHLFLPISPQENNEKMVSSEPFKPDEKMSSWRNDIQSLVSNSGPLFFPQVSNRCRVFPTVSHYTSIRHFENCAPSPICNESLPIALNEFP
jgi:hypothetical protein